MSQDHQPPVFRLDPMGGLLGSGRRPVPPPPRVRFEDVPPPPVRAVPRPVEPAPAKPAAPVAPPRELPQLRVVAPGVAEVAAKAVAGLTQRGAQIVEAPAPAPVAPLPPPPETSVEAIAKAVAEILGRPRPDLADASQAPAPVAAPPPPPPAPAPAPAAPPMRVTLPRSVMGEHYAARLPPDTTRGRILLALGTFPAGATVGLGDLVVRCWEMFPETFALPGHPEHPHSNAILAKLCGGDGLEGLGWIRRPEQQRYTLTADGRRWCEHVGGLR